MNTHEACYQEAQQGAWATLNPNRCGCKGYGWFLSDVDTFHRCSFHGEGVPHPEWEPEMGGHEDYDADRHERAICVFAFRAFRDSAIALGITSDIFQALCRREVGIGEHTPREWVDAAEVVTDMLQAAMNEHRAIQAGFSCHLEARWKDV